MQGDHLVLAEDGLADELLRRGHRVGSGWMVAAGVAGALAIGTWTTVVNVTAAIATPLLVVVGLRRRRRYWDAAERQVGDAAMQRARWRAASDGGRR